MHIRSSVIPTWEKSAVLREKKLLSVRNNISLQNLPLYTIFATHETFITSAWGHRQSSLGYWTINDHQEVLKVAVLRMPVQIKRYCVFTVVVRQSCEALHIIDWNGFS